MGKSIKVNAFYNVLRQCCTVLFPLITYPYVSRVLGSAGLGKYSFADSIIQYFLILAGLGIATYGVREGSIIKDDKPKFERLVAELFTISAIATVISCLLLVLCLLTVPRLREDRNIILILSLNIICALLGRDWLNTVFEDFKYLSVRYVILHLISLVLIFCFIKSPDDVARYAWICLFAASGGYLANIFYTKRLVSYRLASPNFKAHLKPILLLFCSTVAINIYIHSDVTILGFLKSNEDVGCYSVASKVYITVKGVLNAVIVVAIPRLSNYLGNGKTTEYNQLLDKLRVSIYTIMIPSIVGLFILSEDTIRVVGGAEYLSGVNALRILCFALFFAVFGCFYAQGILVPGKREKVFTIATIISALVNIVMNLFLIPWLGIDGAAYTTLLAEMIILTIAWANTKDMGLRFNNKPILGISLGCAVIVLICLVVRRLHLPVLEELALSMLLSVAVYAFVLYLFRNELVMDLVEKGRRMIRRN